MSGGKILLVGCGAMGAALYKGWAKGRYEVTIIDPHVPEAFDRLDLLPPSYHPDVVLFAIKPQVAPQVVPEYSFFTKTDKCPLFLSIMAGTSIPKIQDMLGLSVPVVRAMPNLPVLVGQGITGLVATESLDPQHRQWAENIFAAVGTVVWLEKEDDINGVTALSGSGPAYFFQLVEHLTQAGLTLGLSLEVSENLSRQTLIGAAEILKNSSDSADQWRQRVTSPGGTTAAALNAFETGGWKELVDKAVKAAWQRSIELSQS